MLISDDFDPVLIADKLRAVADGLVDDVTFRATLNDLKKAVAQEVSYRQSVRNICHLMSTTFFHTSNLIISDSDYFCGLIYALKSK